MRKHEKARKRWQTRDKVLLCLGIFALAFIAAMTVTFWIKGSVPDTLIQYTLGAGGLEALLLAGITIAKVFREGKEDE